MDELKFEPVAHDHAAFLEKLRKRKGVQEESDILAIECALDSEGGKPHMQNSNLGGSQFFQRYWNIND